MRSVVALALGGVILAGGALAEPLVGDPDAGRKIANMCRTCHGTDGYAKIPIAPHIGGEPVTYLVRQLAAFRDGTREHEMMTVVTKGLSDQQIADVSSWYANHTIRADLNLPADQAPEACTACHGADGLAVVEDAPHLAGETNIYIETQLKAFRSGKRNNEIMSPLAADLTDNDIRALANWFSRVKIAIEPVAR